MKISHELEFLWRRSTTATSTSATQRLGSRICIHNTLPEKCRYLGLTKSFENHQVLAELINELQSFVLQFIYRKLTRQIQSYTAPYQSNPNLQILLRRDTSASDDASHGLGSVTWMYEIRRYISDWVVLPRHMSC